MIPPATFEGRSLGGLRAAMNMTPAERSARASKAARARHLKNLPERIERKRAERTRLFDGWDRAYAAAERDIGKRAGTRVRREPGPAHGTHSSYSHGCRCGECRSAERDYSAERRRRRRGA